MRFKDVFDKEAPIDSGIIPIWLVLSLLMILDHGLRNAPPVAGIVVPFGVLIGLHWAFRIGRWAEERIRPPGYMNDQDFMRWAMGMPTDIWDQIPKEVRDEWIRRARERR